MTLKPTAPALSPPTFETGRRSFRRMACRIALSYWQNDHWEIHAMNFDGSNHAAFDRTPLNVLVENTIPDTQMVDGKRPHRAARKPSLE
ncbi:MAG: hypothetical protein U0401_19800 [Anaerolineae bacterium]